MAGYMLVCRPPNTLLPSGSGLHWTSKSAMLACVREREREREKVTLSCLLTHTDSHLVLSFTVELMKSGKKPMGEDAVTWSFLRAATCPEVRSSCRMGTPSAPIIAHSGLPLLARGRKDDVSRGIGLPIDMLPLPKKFEDRKYCRFNFFKKIFLSCMQKIYS